MRIAIPMDLAPYIRLRDGEIVFKKQLPDTLNEKFKEFKQEYESLLKSKLNACSSPNE